MRTDIEPNKMETSSAGSGCSVTLLSMHNDGDLSCEVRELYVRIGEDAKTIHHYFFNEWPDFGVPEAEDQRRLVKLMQMSRTLAAESPRIVHDSAGVGRTGTWIALDFLLELLETGRLIQQSVPMLDDSEDSGQDLVEETVDKLREQRMMMVMNEIQYGFIYSVLKDAFVEKYAVNFPEGKGV